MSKKKILLDGFHVSFDGRVLFMKEVFRYPEVRKELVKKLLEEGGLEDFAGCESTRLGNGQLVHLEINEDELIVLFDKLTKKGREIKKIKEADSYMRYLCSMLEEEDSMIEVDLDGVLLLAYGIVNSEGCRQELRHVFTEPEEFYAVFELSKYKECKLGSCIPVEYLWEMRLIIGILLRLRETRDNMLYQRIMHIICCGYKSLRKDIKKHSYMTGNMVKEINTNYKNTQEDAMKMCSQMLITFIVMEEMGVEMMWDFSIGAVLPFIERFEEELEQGFPVNDVDEKIETGQAEWKERFLETYGTQLSVRKLLLEKSDDCNAEAVTKIMAMFDVNPRKFQEYELTEQEHRLVMAQNEKWNSKIYWGVLIIAQLCKYIRDFEKRFLNEVPQYWHMRSWMEEEEKRFDLEKKNSLAKENELLQRKIESLEKSLVVHEQTEKHLQKQIKISENKLQASQEEISNLKAYIYYLSEENPEEYEEKNQERKEVCLEDKQVLVLGGHPGWQNKLRAHYPKWQFLVAEQKNQIDDAVKGKDYIICNTQMLSHSCYYKLLACKEETQKILYVRHTNIEQGILELERQL